MTTVAPSLAEATTLADAAQALGEAAAATANKTLIFDMDLSFNPADYALFIVMMLLSAFIGVYYGFFKKQDSVSAYLHGGKNMAVFPIAMSLISSNVSGITMLAVPAEMYNFGTQFALLGIMAFPATVVVKYLFIPMFYNLQCDSSFEYLELRFDKTARKLGSLMFTLGMLLYMPVVIYVPCLALNQVSGISVHLISPIACLVCVFYTTLGGLKAVVWTDALQLVLLVLASLAVIVLGVMRVGGAGIVWDRAVEGGRIELFNMDPSLYARCTFWNVGLGAFFGLVLNLGASPSSVQRFLSVPSIGAAQRTSVLLAFGYFLTKLFSVLTGLIIFAAYFYCDPLDKKVGAVHKSDQLVPYYVMDVGRDWPGLSGLFVAGVFSAALSTMSAGLNTLSGTLYSDFIEKMLPMKVSDERAASHMKIVTLLIGFFSVAMIFVVENLGSVLQIAISFHGITAGASFGLFIVGMFFPWVNSKGAMAGAVTSLVFMVTTVACNSYAVATGALKYHPLPTRTDGCYANSTLEETFPTPAPHITPGDADVFPVFKVSYFYFSVMGMTVTVVVSLIVSYFTGFNDLEKADPALFSPPVARLLPRHRRQKRDEAALRAVVLPLDAYEAVPTSAEPTEPAEREEN